MNDTAQMFVKNKTICATLSK